jgi:hypothetical protein
MAKFELPNWRLAQPSDYGSCAFLSSPREALDKYLELIDQEDWGESHAS